ncbi:MAG: pentapeptide repeat-containing protein, partial [Planctomycetes bacterium]|nr:pentapeptide repeat-containing protein [Planctomycetota bacterium]
FVNANLRRANLTKAILSDAVMDGATLDGALLEGAKLDGASSNRASMRNCILRRAQLSGRDLTKADLRGSDLQDANLNNVILNSAEVSDAMEGFRTNLKGARLERVDLAHSRMRGAQLAGACLKGASLEGADLRGATMNVHTDLTGASVEGCMIDRHALESMSNFGGLTPGDRMTMVIRDDVATLRSEYSGFLAWIHLGALVLFVFPYVWFVGRAWSVAKFEGAVAEGTITLLSALGRFIVNGGQHLQLGWSPNWTALTLFILATSYNLLRAILLWKTKKLELQETASGLPARFSLVGLWGWLHWAGRIGFYVNILVVLGHTWHFLQQRIPIDSLPRG